MLRNSKDEYIFTDSVWSILIVITPSVEGLNMKTIWMTLGLIAATFVSFVESSRFEYVGLPIIIEHPKWSVRSGTDVEGK